MKPVAFEYHSPHSLDEALATLARVAPLEGRVIAGGQSLVPAMAFRLVRPGHLVDINAIAGLDHLRVEADELVIGACVRHASFHRPVVAGVLGRALTDIAAHVAHYPIRMRGTFCGSLAQADPASEWCLLALTLGARMIVRSVRGERSIPAHAFFQGVMSTDIQPDELLTEVRIPLPEAQARIGFDEFSRRRGDFALAMALVQFDLLDGRMQAVRVGVGAVEATARRIEAAEQTLEGGMPTMDRFQAAARAAGQAVDPSDQPQLPAVYRRELVESCVRRALERALSATLPKLP